ncbi:MAG: S-layer homology domain-containing protein [Clostridia bacterium]|nr:S-layer homology domain-containing protein [Clostridia bacterium]
MKKIVSFILSLVMSAAVFAVLPSSAAKISFSDVAPDRWSAASIGYAVDKGYMNGVGDGKFDPKGSLTRAMVATVLWRREGSPTPTAPSGFTDVPAGAWYADAVAWAKGTGVVNGMTETTFAPDAFITREQLATMLFRFSSSAPVSVPGRADLSAFSDGAKVSSWAKEALEWAVQAGLVNGMDGNRLLPSGNATREQFAAIIERYDGSFDLVFNEPVLRSHYTEPEYPLVTNADFYVSVSGDDSNDGSFDHPFRTWERARDALRSLDRSGRDGVTVAFMAGEYGPLDLTLTDEDSGTAECPVTYCKYGDGDVTFNNGVTLRKDEFKPITDEEKALFPAKAQNSIMRLDLDGYFPGGMPAGLAIFGDSGPIWEARYPDMFEGVDSYLKNVLVIPSSEPNYYGMEVSIGPAMSRLLLNKVNYFKNMKMTGYIMYGWRVDTFYIANYDKETTVITLDDTRLPSDFPSVGIRTPQMMLSDIYFENSPDFLDAEGEYWYDPDSNVIYIYEPDDEYTIGLYGSFLTLNDADFTSFVGLDFKSNREGNAINVRDSENITISGCEISGVYSCLQASGSSDRFTVSGCDLSRFTGHCIRLGQTNHKATLESNHVLIDNNYIHDYGLSKLFNNQAIMDGSIGAVISHNVFKNSPNGAINLGMLSTIEYNVFDNMMTSTQDFGVIYTWNAISSSRGNTIRYNLFGTIDKMFGNAFGIYIDDFTQEQYIYGNLFYHSSLMLHNARDQFVHDNVFIKSYFNTNGFGFVEDGKLKEGLLPDGTGWEDLYRRYYLNRVNEGEEGYEIWRETFPSLYVFKPDVENPFVYESIFCPWDSIHNNVVFGSGFNVADEVKQYGEVYDNLILTEEENPFFVNPTLGDYTLKEGVTSFSIPFEKIGRY